MSNERQVEVLVNGKVQQPIPDVEGESFALHR